MQEQPRVHQATADGDAQDLPRTRPITYGDVFNVSGELASWAIAPRDAAAAQAAENSALGGSQKGGPAAVMQSAAGLNERAGLVDHHNISGAVAKELTVDESLVEGRRVVTESIDGQVIGRYIRPEPGFLAPDPGAMMLDRDSVTIGEALEAAVLSAGEKAVDQSDAAAIQATEVRASGSDRIQPGGVAAAAQSAADLNLRAAREEDKTKLADVLADAAKKLPKDKPVTKEDAEGVIGAELRNNPKMATHPGGVAEAMAAAAGLNQKTNELV